MPNGRKPPVVVESECFEVGKHRLRLERRPDGWLVSVDGFALNGHFPTQAEAWGEGVRTALALEGPAITPAPQAAPPLAGPRGRAPGISDTDGTGG